MRSMAGRYWVPLAQQVGLPTAAPPDLAGELLFIRESIDGSHDLATSTGARVIHCCGFESVPSDLGVLLLRQAALPEDSGELEDTILVVTAFKGGFSGGTLATMKVQQAEVSASPSLKRLIEDPYALSPDGGAEPELGDERDLRWLEHHPELDIWIGPFVMVGINTGSCAAATISRTGLTAVASDTGK